MEELIQQLVRRERALEKVIKRIESELPGLPEGKLWISKGHENIQFYQHIAGDTSKSRIYLQSNKNEKLIRNLSQKDYYELLLSVSRRELAAIRALLQKNVLFSSENVYKNLHEARKNLVRPLLVDDEAYAVWWQQQPYVPNPGYPEDLVYSTKRGEKVRSKAEAMLADMYFDMKIPYKYDYPVVLVDGQTKYVDFALLHKSTRQVIYHEHFGMLDSPQYLVDNMNKLDLYRQSGIYVGKNLILTHDIEGSPLNMAAIRENTKELFCC